MTEPQDRQSWILWIRNNWLCVLGLIIAIVSTALAIYFYSHSKKERSLTYYVNPIRTVIIQSGVSSDLRVFHNDEEIVNDVVAVHIAFWNAGNQSIKRENILIPIMLSLKPDITILEAKIRKQSRDIAQIAISDSLFKDGKIPVSWKILEENDGGVIEVIYEGSPNADITLEGYVEGQREIGIQTFHLKIPSPQEQLKSERILRTMVVFSGILLIGVSVALFVHVRGAEYKYRKMGIPTGIKKGFIYRTAQYGPIITFIVGSAMIIIGLTFVRPPTEPPFGF